MFKDKKILFAIIFLLLSIIFVVGSSYFQNKKKDSVSVGDSKQNDVKSALFPTSTLFPDNYRVIETLDSNNGDVAFLLRIEDGKEGIVITSSDSQKIIYEKYLEDGYTTILADYPTYYSISELTKWQDNNTLHIALYNKPFPSFSATDCGDCNDEQLKAWDEESQRKNKQFQEAVDARKSVKFVDIKIK